MSLLFSDYVNKSNMLISKLQDSAAIKEAF